MILTLHAAHSIATRIAAELGPLCDQIEIAGSIRRQRPAVNDIDLVAIPRDPYEFRNRVLRNSSVIQDGPVNLIVRLKNGFQLDVFMAHRATRDLLDKRPSNFGSLLLCRTGSKEHNIKLCARAAGLGYKWEIYRGLVDRQTGLIVASESEHQIFQALKMDFLPPEEREP